MAGTQVTILHLAALTNTDKLRTYDIAHAMHYVTFQLAQINLSACSMKRSALHPQHNKHIFLSTRRKQCTSGDYSVVWTLAHFQLANRGKHISCSAFFSSWVMSSTPRTARMCYASRGHISKLYIRVCVIFTCAARSPAHKDSCGPFPGKKSWTPKTYVTQLLSQSAPK